MDELGIDEGEAVELGLVDVGDDEVIRGRQHRLVAGEELVEVFRPLAALQREMWILRTATKYNLKRDPL